MRSTSSGRGPRWRSANVVAGWRIGQASRGVKRSGRLTPAVALRLQRCLPRAVLGPERFRGGCTFGARSPPSEEREHRDSPTRVRQPPHLTGGRSRQRPSRLPWRARGKAAEMPMLPGTRAVVDGSARTRQTTRWHSLDVLKGVALWAMIAHHFQKWVGGEVDGRFIGFDGFVVTDLAAPVFGVALGAAAVVVGHRISRWSDLAAAARRWAEILAIGLAIDLATHGAIEGRGVLPTLAILGFGIMVATAGGIRSPWIWWGAAGAGARVRGAGHADGGGGPAAAAAQRTVRHPGLRRVRSQRRRGGCPHDRAARALAAARAVRRRRAGGRPRRRQRRRGSGGS